MTPAEALHRPRIEGEREHEVLEATLEVLMEVGYDRLTMDAVATRAKASKATLYRRWSGKATLVVDALKAAKGPHEAPDTGSLRGDLQAAFCGVGGLTDEGTLATLAAVITAVSRDPEFAEAFRREVLEPKSAVSADIWQRARDRGEISADVDLDLFEPALAGIVLHRIFVMGEAPDPELISRVIDQIILPAVTTDTRPTQEEPS